MEKDLGSWFNHQSSNWQSSNLNSRRPINFGAQNKVPAYANPRDNMFYTNGISPAFAFPHCKPCQPTETRGWFYCLPRFRQAFSPVPDSVPPGKLEDTAGRIQNPEGDEVSNLRQKRFLIFDQSGDQTTFVFSSGIGGSVQYPALNMLIPPPNLKKDDLETKTETFRPSVRDSYNEENEKDDVISEMQEDSEEIDALLYSEEEDDDDDNSDDDDVTSTGHSPSIVTAHYGKEGWAEESEGEVGSSLGLAKRRKVSNVGYSVPSLVDTASSVRSGPCFDYMEDTGSSCGDLSGKKRWRGEKIRETLRVLESIIPGGNDNGKDAIGVIDEAICYLRSLKEKAKALGFDSQDDAYV